MSKKTSLIASTQAAFTLLELMIAATITAILMLAVSSLLITFLATAHKSRISQSLRESGGNAMRQMIEMIRNSHDVNSVCDSDTPLSSLVIVGVDGQTTTFQEENDRLASVAATRTYYLTETSSISSDYVQSLQFHCHPTPEGKKYVEINFTLRAGETADVTNPQLNSPRNTTLEFSSGVVTRN